MIQKVLSGQRLPKASGSEKQADVIDPYVEIEVIGAGKEKTKVIQNNGFNPVWKEQFNFVVPDVEQALVRIAVYDKENLGKFDFDFQEVHSFLTFQPFIRI